MNKTTGFNRDSTAPDLFAEDAAAHDGPTWKEEVNRRLAAHRNRQGATQSSAPMAVPAQPQQNSLRAAQAAARVAARYASAPAYRDLFLDDAEAVVRAAGAAVEAARDAQAAAQAVLDGLQANLPLASDSLSQSANRWNDEPFAEMTPQVISQSSAMPRWHDTIPASAMEAHDVWDEMRVYPASERDLHRTEKFDEFPTGDSVANATVEPVLASAANLIEFPRELVAARKARPRLAEGPFAQQATSPQLNIFEVDPELLSAQETPMAPPQWTTMDWESSIHPSRMPDFEQETGGDETAALIDSEDVLRRLPGIQTEAVAIMESPTALESRAEKLPTPLPLEASPSPSLPALEVGEVETESAELYVAGKSHRALAGIVDFGIVTLAYLGAAVVVLASTDQPPSGIVALEASLLGMIVFALVYLALFFAFSDQGTPGMRYARIALCTFDDNNPTVKQALMRIPAMLLSAFPLGLGFLWAFLDRDGLGWHDRLSQTYQRKY